MHGRAKLGRRNIAGVAVWGGVFFGRNRSGRVLSDWHDGPRERGSRSGEF
jgi:hypothetical protein